MSVGLRSSTIEVFRTRNHGNQILRLYKLSSDGQSLSTLYTLHRGFFIGSNVDIAEGASEFLLTIDIGYSQGLTETTLYKAAWVDLINPDTGKKRRFRMDTEGAPPLLDDYRYIFGLHGAFNDKKAIE